MVVCYRKSKTATAFRRPAFHRLCVQWAFGFATAGIVNSIAVIVATDELSLAAAMSQSKDVYIYSAAAVNVAPSPSTPRPPATRPPVDLCAFRRPGTSLAAHPLSCRCR